MNLNLKLLMSNKLTPNEYVYLEMIYHERKFSDIQAIFNYNYDEIIATQARLLDKEFLRRGTSENTVIITKKGVNLFKSDQKDLENLVVKYRQLFNKENINGVIGKMGNKGACYERMKLFRQNYPEYTDDIILKAAQLYIESERYNHNFKYLQKAHYVISKSNEGRKIKDSRLEEYCEEVLSGTTIENNDDSDFITKA